MQLAKIVSDPYRDADPVFSWLPSPSLMLEIPEDMLPDTFDLDLRVDDNGGYILSELAKLENIVINKLLETTDRGLDDYDSDCSFKFPPREDSDSPIMLDQEAALDHLIAKYHLFNDIHADTHDVRISERTHEELLYKALTGDLSSEQLSEVSEHWSEMVHMWCNYPEIFFMFKYRLLLDQLGIVADERTIGEVSLCIFRQCVLITKNPSKYKKFPGLAYQVYNVPRRNMFA